MGTDDDDRWRNDATCRGMPPDRFYPEDDPTHDLLREALIICSSCPVQRECILNNLHEARGVWGSSMGSRRDLRRFERLGKPMTDDEKVAYVHAAIARLGLPVRQRCREDREALRAVLSA